MDQDDLYELLALALEETNDTARDAYIFAMRYGLVNGEPMTLQEVGDEIGVTRERIRQIVNRTIRRRLRGKGVRDLRNGSESACAQFVNFMQETIQPETEGDVQRLLNLCDSRFPTLPLQTHAVPLVAYLGCTNYKYAKELIKKADSEAKRIQRVLRQQRKELYLQQKLAARFQELVHSTMWPEYVRRISEEEYRTLSPKRVVSAESRGSTGSYFSDKMQHEVHYESGLERDFLLLLEHVDDVRWYQEQCLVISYSSGDRDRIYFPDCLVILNDYRAFVVEVKPVFQMALEVNLAKWAALKQFCADKGLGLLITDGRWTIRQVMKSPINPAYTSAVLDALDGGASLSWREYKIIRDEFGAGRNDFVALVLKNRLVWRLSPFSLTKD